MLHGLEILVLVKQQGNDYYLWPEFLENITVFIVRDLYSKHTLICTASGTNTVVAMFKPIYGCSSVLFVMSEKNVSSTCTAHELSSLQISNCWYRDIVLSL